MRRACNCLLWCWSGRKLHIYAYILYPMVSGHPDTSRRDSPMEPDISSEFFPVRYISGTCISSDVQDSRRILHADERATNALAA